MRLIVETGSFVTEWAIIDQNQVIGMAETEVVNPLLQSRREISRLVRLTLPDSFFHIKYEKVYYYGVGCGVEQRKRSVEASLTTQFRAPVIVDTSLLAAARGMLQDREGIACVLGNASGSCHYDGHDIVESVVSGGYVLGDEGSATVLGEMFIADALKNIAPTEMSTYFFDHLNTSVENVHQLVYEQPHPEKFLASVGLLLKDWHQHPYTQSLVKDNFRKFFERCVKQYSYQGLPMCAVGHMAHDFLPLLREVAKEYGTDIEEEVTNTPMKGLVKYHLVHPNV